jgi:MFS family permease
MGQRPDQGRILFVSALLYGAGFALFGMAPSFSLALVMLAFVGATDTIWSAARGTILQMLTPERFRGRVMGVFQLSNRGLHPLGQLESGILVPLIGAREATVMGGAIVSLMTLLTVWRVPALCRYRWDGQEIDPDGRKVAAEDAAEKLNEAAAQTKL